MGYPKALLKQQKMVCPICGKTIKRTIYLMDLIQSSDNIALFPCCECGKWFYYDTNEKIASKDLITGKCIKNNY